MARRKILRIDESVHRAYPGLVNYCEPILCHNNAWVTELRS